MLALVLGVTLSVLGPLAGPPAPEEVSEAYHRLFEAKDDDGLRDLWSAHPDLILVTIDEDLEQSLSAWEAEGEPDEELIASLHSRAVWGARLGSEATGKGIFIDYAASFVGWDDEQKQSFREGQAAFGRARQALGAGDYERALSESRLCRNLALPLGDWWGTAMGLSMEGLALAQVGELESALAATSRARLLYDQLGLQSSELATLRSLSGVAAALGRWPRALVSAEAALELAREIADDETVIQLLEQRAVIERALGLDVEAEATDREREQLAR